MRKLAWFFGAFLIVLSTFSWQSCKNEEKLDPIPNKKDSSVTLLFTGMFKGSPIDFDNGKYITKANDTIDFSKMKVIFSNFAFKKEDNTYDTMKDVYGYINLVDAERVVDIPFLEPGTYKGMKFYVGLDSAINFGDPNQWGPSHPLNPVNNGMHWSWAGGYQYNSIEGNFTNNGTNDPFTYHMATMEYMREYEFTFDFEHLGQETIYFNLNAEQYFEDPYTFSMKVDGSSSHSTDTLGIMDNIFKNVYNLFEYDKVE